MIVYSSPASRERDYLRMLLNVVRGVTGFEHLITVNDRLCATFKEACFAYGLLNDDMEYTKSFSEATRPLKLWETNWQALSEDIIQELLRRFGRSLTDLQGFATA
ncbi:hypothetical protein Tco_0993541 [Tanacetum coccineum]